MCREPHHQKSSHTVSQILPCHPSNSLWYTLMMTLTRASRLQWTEIIGQAGLFKCLAFSNAWPFQMPGLSNAWPFKGLAFEKESTEIYYMSMVETSVWKYPPCLRYLHRCLLRLMSCHIVFFSKMWTTMPFLLNLTAVQIYHKQACVSSLRLEYHSCDQYVSWNLIWN